MAGPWPPGSNPSSAPTDLEEEGPCSLSHTRQQHHLSEGLSRVHYARGSGLSGASQHPLGPLALEWSFSRHVPCAWASVGVCAYTAGEAWVSVSAWVGGAQWVQGVSRR